MEGRRRRYLLRPQNRRTHNPVKTTFGHLWPLYYNKNTMTLYLPQSTHRHHHYPNISTSTGSKSFPVWSTLWISWDNAFAPRSDPLLPHRRKKWENYPPRKIKKNRLRKTPHSKKSLLGRKRTRTRDVLEEEVEAAAAELLAPSYHQTSSLKPWTLWTAWAASLKKLC